MFRSSARLSNLAWRSSSQKTLFQFQRSVTTLNTPPTQVTTLPNGIRVASEPTPGQTATVGVWLDTGSAYETDANNGTAHFLEHMFFKGTNRRSKQDIELEIENRGAALNAYTGREITGYFSNCFSKDVEASVDLIADMLQNSKLDPRAIEQERGTILREKEEVENIYSEAIMDYLHAAGYQGGALGRTILGSNETIQAIQRDHLTNYIQEHYTGNRMVVVGTGAVDHQALVKSVEKQFAGIRNSTAPYRLTTPIPFTGSEIKIVNEDQADVHFAIGVPAVGHSHPDYFAWSILGAIIGQWNVHNPGSYNTPSRLASVLAEDKIASSLSTFVTHYHGTGMFGCYAITDPHNMAETVYEVCNEFQRLGQTVTDRELERAKNEIKTSLMLSLDGTQPKAEEIARSLLNLDRRLSPSEIFTRIDRVSASDIKRIVYEHFHDQDPAVVAVGNLIPEFPDYVQIRGWMYHNRV